MPSPTPLNDSSLVTRSERQRSPAVSELFSPASRKSIFFLACLMAAASIFSSWVSMDPSASQPSLAQQLDDRSRREDDWLARVQRGLAEKEYRGEPQPCRAPGAQPCP